MQPTGYFIIITYSCKSVAYPGSEVRVGRQGLAAASSIQMLSLFMSEPRWVLARSPQNCKQFAAVNTSMQCSCQVRPPSAPTPKKETSDLCESHMTQHSRGRVGTCLPVATLLLQIQ